MRGKVFIVSWCFEGLNELFETVDATVGACKRVRKYSSLNLLHRCML